MPRTLGPLCAALLCAALPLAPSAALRAVEPVPIDLAARTWQGIPGLERTAKGRVFVSWFTGGPKEPAPENAVVLSRSEDGGTTFSAPQVMAAPASDGTRCFDPTLWIDPRGRLWYVFNRGNKDIPRHDVWARICTEPDAPEPVFGAEFRVGFDVPYAFRMNKPTVLSTGEWIMPVTHASEPIRDWFANDKQRQGVAISTDEGRSWTLHGALEAPPWALECMITELRDGRLWLLTRTGGGFLWESHSADRGRTWTAAKASGIASPGSRFFIRRLASGSLLLVNHHNFTGRSHLTARLSTDDGASWNDGLLLDERKGVSYPDGVQDADGLIWITYDRDRGGAGEILLARFREEDVAAGRNASGAVRLKQVVSRLDKPPLLPAGWNAKAAADEVLARLVRVSAPQVKGAHDAEFVCVGDRAYVVEHDNDVAPGHGAGKAMYCVLTVVNLKTLAVEKTHLLAKAGQAFATVTLPDAEMFVPRIIRKDEHTLRAYFCSQPAKEQAVTWYRDFDLRTQSFADTIHKAKLKTAAGTFDMEPRHFHADAAARGFTKPAVNRGLYIFDSFKEFDGRRYVALNDFEGKQNALALLLDDFATFEIVGHYNEPQAEQLSESAVNRLPDGTWMAICRNDKGNYHFTTSKDGRTWSVAAPRPFVPNGLNSKPTFDRFGGVYYLGWQENTKVADCGRSVFNVDVSRDGTTWERKYRFESPHSFQYPTFHEHEGTIWLAVTQSDHKGSSDRIMFSRLEDLPRSAAEAASLQPPRHLGPPRPEQAATNRAFTGIPSMAVTPQGRLWATWYAGVTPGEDANNYVVLSTSGDGGATWQEVLVVDPDGEGPVRAFDPELWVSPDGRLFFFWAQMDRKRHDPQLGVWYVETATPEAAAPAWSAPRRVGDGVMMCKPIVLSTGEWALPISLWREHDKSAQIVVSTDAGKTWAVRGACHVPKDDRQFDEHMIVERKDGSLWMLVRTKYGIGESVSADRGATWPDVKPSAILHTPSRFFVSRLASGSLLLVKHGPLDTRTGRSHLTAFISEDDGATWTGGLLLDERAGVSYPDGQQTADGTIRIIYDYNRVTDREILMAMFREEDAAAGKDVTGVRLRQLVGKASGGQKPPQQAAAPVRDNADGKPLVKEPAGSLASGDVKPQPLVPGTPLFSDRGYAAAKTPPALAGARFLPIAMDGSKTIRCDRDGMVYFLTPVLDRNRDSAAQPLLDQGFEKVSLPETPLFNPGSAANYCTLYQKRCVVGETILIGKWAVPVFFP